MRSAITQVSSLMFGASVLIFILALIIPLLKESPSLAEHEDSLAYRSPSPSDKAIEASDIDHIQTPAEQSAEKPTITPIDDKAIQNQATISTEPVKAPDTSGLASGMAAPETAPVNPDPITAKPTPEPPKPPIVQEAAQLDNASHSEEKPPVVDEPTTLLVLGDGLFAPGDTSPKTNMQEAIEKIIPIINEKPDARIVVEGHADQWTADGVSPEQATKLNQSVSLRRADVVAKVLQKNGISRDKIIVKGIGDAEPVASNDTQEGRAKNRRVEIKLLPK